MRRSISSLIRRVVSASLPAGSSSSQSTYDLPGMYGHSSPQPIVTTTSAHSASARSSLRGTRPASSGMSATTSGCTCAAGARAGRARLVVLPCGSAKELLRHLRASGVLDADEENVRHRG